VLAGGSSRRFAGAPKGLEKVGRRRIIDRVAEAIRGAASELTLAANAPDAKDWLPGVAVVPDVFPGTGGLAGIHAALASGRDALVVAWDMPFVTADLLRDLDRIARSTGASVVVPESGSPQGIEPFCAYYGAAVRTALDAYLRAGGGSACRFLDQLEGVRRMSDDEVRAIGDPERLFFSVNTPDDLARARAMARAAR